MAMANLDERRQSRGLLWMTGIFVASAGLAILPLQEREVGGGLLPIPGYTASLALAVLPLIALLNWVLRGGDAHRVERKAFGYTLLLVVPLWTLLDVFFAHTFFLFPKPEATLGIFIPGRDPALGWVLGWGWNIPIEELVFYLAACLSMVLLYAWSAERWFGAYRRSREDYQRHGPRCVSAIRFDRRKLLLAGALFATLYAFKKLGMHPYNEGFPGYALFLIVGGLLPAVTIYPTIAPFINKQAMLFTMTVVVLLSLVWEVTLGLPNGWWGYQKPAMVGIFLRPWSGLPLEASFLWLVAGWGNVVFFEFFRLQVSSGLPLRALLFKMVRDDAERPQDPATPEVEQTVSPPHAKRRGPPR